MKRIGLVACAAILIGLAWMAGADDRPTGWTEVVSGVWVSTGTPCGYALISGKKAMLIDAPVSTVGLKAEVAGCLITHHHADTLAALGSIPARAPKASAPWLTPDGIAAYWKAQFPLRNSRTAYLVMTKAPPKIAFDIEDGKAITWEGWTITPIAAPGHSPDHFAYMVQREGGPRILFAGDALVASGKLWSPYTTDWDHWTDVGLRPTEETLRKLAGLKADVVLPAHGSPIGRELRPVDVKHALETTADAVKETGYLKSYERYTRERRKDPPRYAFLAREQAGSNGSKPWSKISPNLWLTGNTYVLASKDGPVLVVDPWSPHSDKQIPKLLADEKLGKPEVVLCSHAHFDHYDGAYVMADKPQVWALSQVADPIEQPARLRAPFLDARPLKVARRFEDGQTATWREYTFKFHFLPGQTLFTMGVETTIDGKRCLFTADNFFHHELYSGTGGWMGLNRSGPGLYERSARKVLSIAPDWVLAEHGSAMEFNAEDFRRRVEWAQEAGKRADALCVSGDHRNDWSPHSVRIEPLVQTGKLDGEIVVENALPRARKLRVWIPGGPSWNVEVGPNATLRRKVEWKPETPGIFRVWAVEGETLTPGDAFVAIR
ncbi:MAG: MBL fold metallo-hydrolase [Planctomycetia bacterium]|nr:MBL fold metallo-hydrolase [Planctomycetia bacterium]